ncbi:MAG: 5-methylcytosine restriction system specificity protein McrC [Christensenellales bacterium]
MKADIMIETNDKVLIIDAKYYTHSMQKQFDATTLHSSHLYQIFTYIKNKSACGKQVSGLLLYAKTDEAIFPDNSYLLSGNKISARILDLNSDFDNIKQELHKIIKTHELV